MTTTPAAHARGSPQSCRLSVVRTNPYLRRSCSAPLSERSRPRAPHSTACTTRSSSACLISCRLSRGVAATDGKVAAFKAPSRETANSMADELFDITVKDRRAQVLRDALGTGVTISVDGKTVHSFSLSKLNVVAAAPRNFPRLRLCEPEYARRASPAPTLALLAVVVPTRMSTTCGHTVPTADDVVDQLPSETIARHRFSHGDRRTRKHKDGVIVLFCAVARGTLVHVRLSFSPRPCLIFLLLGGSFNSR